MESGLLHSKPAIDIDAYYGCVRIGVYHYATRVVPRICTINKLLEDYHNLHLFGRSQEDRRNGKLPERIGDVNPISKFQPQRIFAATVSMLMTPSPSAELSQVARTSKLTL